MSGLDIKNNKEYEIGSFPEVLIFDDYFDIDPQNSNLDINPQQKINKKLLDLSKNVEKGSEKEAIKKNNSLNISKNVSLNEKFLSNINIIKKYNQIGNIIWIGSQMFPNSELAKSKINYKNINSKNSQRALKLIKDHFGLSKTPNERIKILGNIIQTWKNQKIIYENNHAERKATKGKDVKMNTYILGVLQMLANMGGEEIKVDFTRGPNTEKSLNKMSLLYKNNVISKNTLTIINLDNKKLTPKIKMDNVTKSGLDLRWTNWALVYNNLPAFKITKI